MAKNQSLPAHLQEKDSRGEETLTTHEHHEKPTTWWPMPNLSNPRSTNDIVWAFSRANPTQLGSLRFVSLHYILYGDNNYQLWLYSRKYMWCFFGERRKESIYDVRDSMGMSWLWTIKSHKIFIIS